MKLIQGSRAMLFAIVATTLAPASAVVAAPATTVAIGGLFNTGVDDNGNALAGGNGVSDPHYVVISSNVGISTGVPAKTYFNASYIADSATSRWISNSGDGNPGNGIVVFRLSFDLTGLDPTTAVISGLNAVDNGGAILLNNKDAGVGLNGSFGSLVPFSISSGFTDGINTLDFMVIDFGPPLALRIEGLSGTAQLAAVPVPASLLMMAPALVGLGAARRKRRV